MIFTRKKIIIFLYLISLGFADILLAHPKTQILSHSPTSYQYINFQYKEPINGISIHGKFYPYRNDYLDPPVQPRYKRYEGTIEVTLTRLSDMKSTTKEFRNVSFVLTDHCLNFDEYDYQNPINECILGDPLFLEPTDYYGSNFLPKVGLQIIDYDYDNKNELILIRPNGYRGESEFFIYEIIDNQEEFRIGYEFLDKIPFNIEFDYENKTMKYNYSGGACLSNFYYLKAEGLDGYKLYKRINTDMIDIDGQYICKKTIYLE